jgi:hypothetical protein
MTLYDVATERIAYAKGGLDVQAVAGLEPAQRGSGKRLRDDVEGETSLLRRYDGEADAGDGHGVTDGHSAGGLGRGDDQA